MWLLTAAVAIPAAGCYEYVAVAPGVPAPGIMVRADLTEAAAPRLTSILGPGVIQVHGMVLRQDENAINMLVDSYSTLTNGDLSAMNEPLLLAYPEIRVLTMKQLSKKKSVLFGAAFVGGAVLTGTVFTDLGRRLIGQGGDGNPDPELRTGGGFRIPLGIRFPVPIR